MVYAATSLFTKAPAAIIAPLPIRTPLRIVTRAPIQTSSSITHFFISFGRPEKITAYQVHRSDDRYQ